jgi:hypothetical protein
VPSRDSARRRSIEAEVEKRFHEALSRGHIAGLGRRIVRMTFDRGFTRMNDDVRKGAPRCTVCDLSGHPADCTDGRKSGAHGACENRKPAAVLQPRHESQSLQHGAARRVPRSQGVYSRPF